MRFFLAGAVALLVSGCASLGVSPQSASLVSYELGYALGGELASVSSEEAVGAVSDSLSAVLLEAVESSFRSGFSDGLASE